MKNRNMQVSGKGMSRRAFVRNTTLAGVGLAMAAPAARVLGANEEIRVAVVGIHGRGGGHINEYLKIPGVRVAALCDVDKKVLAARAEALAKKNNPVRTYVDVRDLLAAKDVDAVSVATPNHWHSLITVWACQAGKDVYVEKPCSHNVFEGRKCVEAARKYRRIVQHGTQSRASRLQGLLLQAAVEHRVQALRRSARVSGLQSLARPGSRAALPRQPGPLQLALVLACTRWTSPAGPSRGRRSRSAWSAWEAATSTAPVSVIRARRPI